MINSVLYKSIRKKIGEKIINIVVVNTGGTFNKEYNQIKGQLEVREDSFFIESIFASSKIIKKDIKGLLYKDSLEITDTDRKGLVEFLTRIKTDKILIIHGTDTMNITAKYIDNKIKNKTIVLTGAMQPYSIEPIEATANLMLGFGYLQSEKNFGVYIAMHGNIKEYSQIKKNKEKGIFECLS